MTYKLCVLGCGTMGIAIVSGVLDSISSPASTPLQSRQTSGTSTPTSSQIIDNSTLPSSFVACVAREESVRKLRKIFNGPGVAGAGLGRPEVEVVSGDNVKAVRESEVVLLCCKPQLAETILTEEGMASALEGKLVISILAGSTISQLQACVPSSTRVVRAMPNTPCKIREGMTVLSTLPASHPSTPLTRQILLSIFTPIGRCRFLDEKHFDACTALSGSGPAFACLMLEAMADGGVMMGLPRGEALELAAQTMQGAARMVLQSGSHPAQIKDSVTTPGGCTIAGLLNLEDGRVRSTIARSIQVAAQHAAGLGAPAGGKAASRDIYGVNGK